MMSNWWDELSPEGKEAYKKKYPNSKYAKGGKPIPASDKTKLAANKRKRDNIQNQIDSVKKNLDKYKKAYELNNDSDSKSMMNGLENRLLMLEKDLFNINRVIQSMESHNT